ncbi:MAG: aldehyde ferredoxin oxidoreductase C-terminal domain-containing protein [Bacillota bacterium]
MKDGKYKGLGEGPEYEATWALGSNIGLDDFEAISKVNFLCNEYGLDPISFGGTISCAVEMYQKKIIPTEDVEFPLNWGDGAALVELIKMTAYRKGFGDALAEGSYRLAEKYGHPEYSMTVKKQELPAYDPRGAAGHRLELRHLKPGRMPRAGLYDFSGSIGHSA